MEKTLHLVVTGQWFDMIYSRVKREEYREIKPFWVKRLIDTSEYPSEEKGDTKNIAYDICFDIGNGAKWPEIVKDYYCTVIDFDTITFHRAYAKNAPIMVISNKGIHVGPCRPEWSGNMQGDHFVISLGEILETKNIK